MKKHVVAYFHWKDANFFPSFQPSLLFFLSKGGPVIPTKLLGDEQDLLFSNETSTYGLLN